MFHKCLSVSAVHLVRFLGGAVGGRAELRIGDSKSRFLVSAGLKPFASKISLSGLVQLPPRDGWVIMVSTDDTEESDKYEQADPGRSMDSPIVA